MAYPRFSEAIARSCSSAFAERTLGTNAIAQFTSDRTSLFSTQLTNIGMHVADDCHSHNHT
jgi:hypothetical protein